MGTHCNIQYLEDVTDDLDKLSDEIFDECMLMIDKLKNNIHLGQSLQNKNGQDLSGCYKLYFNNAKYRIVYKKIDTGYEIVGVTAVPKPVAEIIAIGKRNGQQVYKTATDRLKE